MNLERRLEKLEAAIAEQRQETPDPADLSRLSTDELRDLEDLAAAACGDDHTWDLSKLAGGELRELRTLVDKARGATVCP